MRKSKKKTDLLPYQVLVLATVLSVYAFTNTGEGPLAISAQRMVAAATVSMSAEIPTNPYNALASQLETKKTELARREAALTAREDANNGGASAGGLGNILGMLSFIASIILFLLVGANFYFDAKRGRGTMQSFAVDLRTK